MRSILTPLMSTSRMCLNLIIKEDKGLTTDHGGQALM